MELIPGKRYLLIHRGPLQRYDRESVMIFLGVEYHPAGSAGEPYYQFSARPVAGTQTLPDSWIKEVYEVTPDERIRINQRAVH